MMASRGADAAAQRREPEKEKVMMSSKRLARIAGLLYLLVAIFGGFALAFVYPRIYVAGDAAKTAGNVVAHSALVRIGVVADLFQATVVVFVAITLYHLLKHVNKSVAGTMVVLAAIGVGINCLTAIFEFEGLRVATGAVNLAASGTAGSNALVLLLLDTQHYGVFAQQIFYGLWLAPMGYLVYKSLGMFPKWLGVLLVLGAACYLVDLLWVFLLPDFGKEIHGFISIPSAIAEISMVLYLLVIGVKNVKTSRPEERILAAE